jgi:hypothetical protein
MDQWKKICRAILAALMGAEIIETSLHGREEFGIVAHKAEMSKDHTEPEVQEMISFSKDQAVLTPPAIPFIPSSYDPSAVVIRARKKQMDDYHARVMSWYFNSQSTPLALISSQSAPS